MNWFVRLGVGRVILPLAHFRFSTDSWAYYSMINLSIFPCTVLFSLPFKVP